MALTAAAKSSSESIRVPSRSKMISLMFLTGSVRSVRIIAFQYSHTTFLLALKGRTFRCAVALFVITSGLQPARDLLPLTSKNHIPRYARDDDSILPKVPAHC